MALCEVKGLRYCYPGRATPALEIDQFQIDEGETILLAGHSGSGKSTFARLLAGLVPNFYGGSLTGCLFFEGNPVSFSSKRDGVGYVFQDPEAQILMGTVQAELAFGLENLGLEQSEIKLRIAEVASQFELEPLLLASTESLSSGLQQRVALASIMAMQPKLLILDEPTSQLDRQSTESLLSLIRSCQKEVSTVIIEHRIAQLLPLVDRVVVFQDGNIGWDGPATAAEGELTRRKILPAAAPATRRKKLRGPQEPTLSVTNASYFYPSASKESEPALHDVSLSVRAGERVVLVGDNGAGKSTLLKLLSGAVKPSSGVVRILNDDAVSRVRFVGQNPNAHLIATRVVDELQKPFSRPQGNEEAEAILNALDLWKHRLGHPRDLSSGERARVAIATEIVGDATFLLLDEPTRGQDYQQKEALVALLSKLTNESGLGIVVATHDEDFLELFQPDSIIELSRGCLIESSGRVANA